MELHLPEQAVAAVPTFEELVRAEQAQLLRIAWRFTHDAEDARDLVQAALADAYERRGSLREGAAAGAWLRRILVHRAINLHRRRKVWGTVQKWLNVAPRAEPPGADVALDRLRRMESVQRAVSELPARQAATFTLRYLEGLSLDEIAETLEIDRGTVRVHLHRALQKLKALGALKGEEA